MKRKCKHEIIFNILQTIYENKQMPPNKLLQKTKTLSSKTFNFYINLCLKKKYIIKENIGYIITPRGEEILKSLKELLEIMK